MAAPAPAPANEQAGVPPPLNPWRSLSELLDGELGADTDLVLLPSARRPPPHPIVTVATWVNARPGDVAAVLQDPTLLRQALPSLIRADVVATRAGLRAVGWPDRLLSWEVEVPLVNLTGRAWLRRQPDGTELTLTEGAFAPGWIRFHATPAADGRATVLTCTLSIDVRSANWIFRHVAGHDPWAEAAMTAATAWVMARALALRAEAPRPSPTPSRPRGAIQPPPTTVLDGSFLGRPTFADLRSAGVLAAVRRRQDGRLAWTSVAVEVPGSAGFVASRLAAPETWAVYPGWRSVRRPLARAAGRVARAGAGAGAPLPTFVDVEDDVPLVDLDATWSVESGPPTRATAVKGATRGAVFAWQVAPGRTSDSTLAVLSMHPHLDGAGFIERRLIVAEPLLEHALALALAYVDAAAIAESFDRGTRSAPPSAPASSGPASRPPPRPSP